MLIKLHVCRNVYIRYKLTVQNIFIIITMSKIVVIAYNTMNTLLVCVYCIPIIYMNKYIILFNFIVKL